MIEIPRVKELRTNYMKSDARKMFKVKMAENEIKQKSLAELIGLSPSAFCIRFKDFDFSYEQLIKMIPKIGLSDEDILKLMKG